MGKLERLTDWAIARADKNAREIALCLEVLSSMSSRWPLAKNCHIVLSDLQQTVRLNRDTLLHGPPYGMPTPGPRSSFQAIGRHVSNAAGKQTPDQARTPKRRRLDPDAQAGQPSGLHSGGLQPHPNGLHNIRPQADQTYSLGPGEAATLGSVINDPASRLASILPPDRQPAEAPALNQPPLQQLQQQDLLPPHDPPIAGTPDIRGLDAMGFSTPGFGGGDNGLMGGPSVGNWDGGMPDILGGVTWESLLNVVNQDNLAWRGGFL